MGDILYSVFDAAEEKHWWFVGRRMIVLALLEEVLSSRGRLKILDVGCGTGATLKQLESYGEAIGVDISEEAVDCCRQRGCRDVRVVEEKKFPFPEGEFDCLVSLDVIEHVEDDSSALLEYRRILKPGGLLLITVPAYGWLWSIHDDINRHRRRYSKRLFRRRLLQAEFTLQRLTYFSTLLFPLIVPVRLGYKVLDRAFGYRKEGLDFRIPPHYVNRFLCRLFSSEAAWVKRRNFPFGSSLLAICRKKNHE